MTESLRSTGDQDAEPTPAALKRSEQGRKLGARVKSFRLERSMNLSQLAAKANLSKSYVSAIEAGDAPRPSGETLYAIAEALGVLMSDILGRQVLPTSQSELPPSLVEFASDAELPEADLKMLASIQFRGDQPRTRERWALIYSTIRQTEWMDTKPGDPPAHS